MKVLAVLWNRARLAAFLSLLAAILPMIMAGKVLAAPTIYLPGAIPGAGAYSMLLDTGAGYAAINEDILRKVHGAQSTGTLHGTLADGRTKEFPLYRIPELTVGDCLIKDVDVAVLPKSTRPILGMSVLMRLLPIRIAPGTVELTCPK